MTEAYPKYKDSGAPWIGKVPDNWDVLPNRTLFYEIKERGHIDEQLISVTISQGIIRQTDLISNSSKKDSSNEDKSKYKLVVPGDIAYNKMRAWQGAVGVSQYRGIVSPAYIVVRTRRKQNAKYFHYLLRTPAFAKEAERWSYGITSDQWSLRAEHFKMIYCPVPSIEEQKAIVEYLDVVNKIIHRYIREKQKVIKLLSEQKQAVINKAVTRGVDPNVRFKSSGIEWLGDIPEHWEIRRLKNVGKALIGLTYSPDDISDDSGMLVLRSSNIKNGKMVREKDVYVKKQVPEKLIVKLGDILICARNGSRKLVGKCAIVNKDFSGATFGVFMSIFRSQINDFIYCVLNSNIFGFLAANFSTSTINQLTINDLNNLPIPLPPRNEQKNIVNYITEESVKFDETISRMDKEIEIIREYRARLISDAVTGKIDVRDIKLPEIEDVTNSETIEDQETLEDVEDTEEVVNANE